MLRIDLVGKYTEILVTLHEVWVNPNRVMGTIVVDNKTGVFKLILELKKFKRWNVFAYLKSDPSKAIVYLGKHGLQLRGFVDNDFTGYEDSRRSSTGWMFILAGGPISWSS